MGDPTILQFAPFSSAVDAGFWHQLTKLKLDVLQLNDGSIPVIGTYVNTDSPGLPTRLAVEYDALDDKDKKTCHWSSCTAVGTLINTNTIEEFRKRDKFELLNACGATLWDAMTSGSALQNPSILASFLMFTFTDLKKYHYYYWFAFPAFTLPKGISLVKKPLPLPSLFTEKQISSLLLAYTNLNAEINRCFFSIACSGDDVSVHSLQKYPELKSAEAESGKLVFLGFSDPCTLPQNPGWPLRNLLTLIAMKWSDKWSVHRVVCLRVRVRNSVQEASHSIVVDVDLEGVFDNIEDLSVMPQCLGWEKNERGKMGPRMVNLSASMDPKKLAESAVDLNLKLMRWRVAPQLNLSIVQNTRCLLFGAGTLGCSVARCLLGWGVRNITLVDNGKVSFSNPVRQNLFTFEDCVSMNGGQYKATAAADALLKIFPSVNVKGVVLNVPMPGHNVSESLEEQVQKDLKILEELVEAHDVMFLLMDSRESRWLPTMLGYAKQKLVFTAALGFDSYCVMRHGYRKNGCQAPSDPQRPPSVTNAPIPGHLLGCYFCNDVVAPGDSTRDRTLDQQCTVTRPGVSYIAAAHVVELMVSVLQHPDQGLAEANVSDEFTGKEGVLGAVPHSVRGFLGRYQQLTPATSVFLQCPACCEKVLSAYREDGFQFLLKVFNSSTYLEEVAGLGELQQLADDSEIWELSDNEDEMTS